MLAETQTPNGYNGGLADLAASVSDNTNAFLAPTDADVNPFDTLDNSPQIKGLIVPVKHTDAKTGAISEVWVAIDANGLFDLIDQQGQNHPLAHPGALKAALNAAIQWRWINPAQADQAVRAHAKLAATLHSPAMSETLDAQKLTQVMSGYGPTALRYKVGPYGAIITNSQGDFVKYGVYEEVFSVFKQAEVGNVRGQGSATTTGSRPSVGTEATDLVTHYANDGAVPRQQTATPVATKQAASAQPNNTAHARHIEKVQSGRAQASTGPKVNAVSPSSNQTKQTQGLKTIRSATSQAINRPINAEVSKIGNQPSTLPATNVTNQPPSVPDETHRLTETNPEIVLSNFKRTTGPVKPQPKTPSMPAESTKLGKPVISSATPNPTGLAANIPTKPVMAPAPAGYKKQTR